MIDRSSGAAVFSGKAKIRAQWRITPDNKQKSRNWFDECPVMGRNKCKGQIGYTAAFFCLKGRLGLPDEHSPPKLAMGSDGSISTFSIYS